MAKPTQRELELRALREAQWQSQQAAPNSAVPNAVVPNKPVPNKAVPNVPNSEPVPNSNDAARVAKWKAANQER
jgi:hypothetical protein